MKRDFKYREIPYNYTSFSDREIILKYYDQETWDIINVLRNQRVTGRSAKLLYETIGDYFIIDRNPYIYSDYLEDKAKLRRLKKLHEKRLAIISGGANNNPLVARILERTMSLDREFFDGFAATKRFRFRAAHEFRQATARENIHFEPFHRVAHVTDASDWRVEYPAVVVYPDSVSEMPGLIRAAKKLCLAVIPRGGGTGLTGGAVPVLKNTLVINTEKLRAIGPITTVREAGRDIPVVSVEAGAVTDDVIEYCGHHGYIFATDPTSAWASTIGGNIAENAGGKKCVMWGTAIDNILSFRIVNAAGQVLEVKRRDHPYRKIREEDSVIFDVTRNGAAVKTVTLRGTDIRKKGLGKDITNKALGGLPGIQKEGGDGIIIDATFILYRPFAHRRTICLEFYGTNMKNAAKAIVNIKNAFEGEEGANLTALEHFDEQYVSAINYRNKSGRIERPKAVLLIDVESNEEADVESACARIISMVKPYNTEAMVARNEAEGILFWSDRKNLGAIAKHTNAFKLNEDIVIPLEELPAFADFVERLNLRKELANALNCIARADEYLAQRDRAAMQEFTVGRIDACRAHLDEVKQRYTAWLEQFDDTGPDGIFRQVQDGAATISFRDDVERFIPKILHGYTEMIDGIDEVINAERKRKIIIATHMHAGDGNIHVNIPVHSNDYAMMQEADETAGIVMKQAVALGGVISGEHGIGLTKLRYIDRAILDDFDRYNRDTDPEDLFNPGKLTADFPLSRIYTPSFNLLELEAFILEATDLEELMGSMASCVRCGKCKAVCNTHYPGGTMFFNPRNKILGVALVMEAVLYDAQTSTTFFKNFRKLQDISDHCTICHKCAVPCPVKIDFGEITLMIRKLLVARRKKSFKLMTQFALFYLRRKGYYFNKVMRPLMYRLGYNAQKFGYYLNRPFRYLTGKVVPKLSLILSSPLPGNAGERTLRERLGLKGGNNIYSFENPGIPVKKSVIYFPGCGSERMFPEISMAVIALLYRAGVRVVIPPEYLCCGYPFLANGQEDRANIKSYENRILLHRIADIIGYMDISDIIVSCGTCYDMIEKYEVENIFSGAGLTDISEFIYREGLYRAEPGLHLPLMYHEPCHTPLKAAGSEKVITRLFGTAPRAVPYCCGEVGTLSMSRPDISETIRGRKTRLVQSAETGNDELILTACPSCVQGLLRSRRETGLAAKHVAVYAAEQFLGERWKRDFLREIKKRGCETILF